MTGEIIGGILTVIIFIIIVASCCASDSGSTASKTKRNTNNTIPTRKIDAYDNSYSECPACGAPYYDGYCEECGYPDINQGWIGENY